MADMTIDIRSVLRLGRRVSRLGRAVRLGAMRVLAPLLESQTRRRIGSEKRAPSGRAWEAWSDRYAATRTGTQSLLMSDGHLHDSIESLVTPDKVTWGSNLVYASTHQDGTDDVPARPFLGLSRDNAREIDAELVRFFDRVVAAS
jgi:phage virion morphogenesis protein